MYYTTSTYKPEDIPLMEKCSLFSANAIEEPLALLHICKQLLALKTFMVKKSQWIFGGDGWGEETSSGCFDSEAENWTSDSAKCPPDIPLIDHVLASGEDVNVVVVDTEVYSNTGGQSSNEQNFQWTFCPAGAVAKFATSGKKIRKKDLGMIAKSYGYVYVAQVAMGASQAQYFCQRLRTPLNKSNEVSKVIKEAEAYHGPSLIICYAPCISRQAANTAEIKINEVSNHGIKIGMGRTQNEEKKAVECGYWHLWHYNPAEEETGQNGFHLDSKEPDWSKFRDFIMGEVRYNSLMKTFPQEAEELFVATERNAKLRYEGYKKLSEM